MRRRHVLTSPSNQTENSKAVYEYDDDHVAKQLARTRIQISIIGNYQCDFRKFASYISVSKVGVYVALVGNVYCT
jgi:hypothetical protein